MVVYVYEYRYCSSARSINMCTRTLVKKGNREEPLISYYITLATNQKICFPIYNAGFPQFRDRRFLVYIVSSNEYAIDATTMAMSSPEPNTSVYISPPGGAATLF